jgi:type IV pilus assembly protein PilC
MFHYTARNGGGELVRGSMQAVDSRSVLALLRSRALFVTALQPESDIAARLGRTLRGGLSRPALLTFFRSFATLVRAGVSIQRALDVTIERATDRQLTEALRCVLADVEQGSTLSEAMSRRPLEFPSLYAAMMRAGETGGILDDVLERLALLLEREAMMQKKLRAALAYPAVVTSAALALTVFLLVAVVPMFSQLFASFHVDLPAATQMLVWLGQFLATPLPWLTAGIALPVAAFGAYGFARTPAGALTVDRWRLRLPIVGMLLHKAIAARSVRMLATLLRSGIELVSAIETVVPVAGSPCYARAFERINRGLRDGEPFGAALAASPLFDPMIVALVRVGEETGALDDMLFKLAEYLESDVEAAIATLGAIIEPVLVIVLGGAVGFIVFSVFLPLYTLIGSVSK